MVKEDGREDSERLKSESVVELSFSRDSSC